MKYIVDIKGIIKGDYEIIGKYEERLSPAQEEAVIDAVKHALIEWSHMSTWRDNQILKAIVERLAKQPPAQPWIPCSERQPKEKGTYMTTLDYGIHSGLAVGQRYYHGNVFGWEDDCVVAWMPLLEPWKGEIE